MDAKGCEGLSGRERECLRLVARSYQHKEIARDLGISVESVKTILQRAREKLQTPSSREAARIFSAWENGPPSAGTPRPGGHPSPRIVDTPAQVDGEADARSTGRVQQERVPFAFGDVGHAAEPARHVRERDSQDGIASTRRVALSLLIALALLSLAVLAPAAGDGFQRLANLFVSPIND